MPIYLEGPFFIGGILAIFAALYTLYRFERAEAQKPDKQRPADTPREKCPHHQEDPANEIAQRVHCYEGGRAERPICYVSGGQRRIRHEMTRMMPHNALSGCITDAEREALETSEILPSDRMQHMLQCAECRHLLRSFKD